uniref:Nudix hydrolase domain-containing protein n=1 Tax=viral metagenome TaxID=1070528 RepID=A0A6C0J4A0_9ZZZZ
MTSEFTYVKQTRFPTCLSKEYNPNYNDKFIESMKHMEELYWKYLDNYNTIYPVDYPNLNINDFMKKLDTSLSKSCIKNYIATYRKYKKTLPTAGIILYYFNKHDIYFPVVCMTRARLYSMPKGKQDHPYEPIMTTAVREFHEETGISVDDIINSDTKSIIINKTRFYIIETDNIISSVYSHKTNEISDVKWVSVSEVISNKHLYSNQTLSSATWLTNHLA